MKRIIILAILIITLITTPSMVFAQPMMGTQSAVSSDSHTAREEAEGKEIWEKLQAKQLECKNLTGDNFEVLGEYFMGQMAGGSHEAMNNMMVRMMGEEGEKQMHIAMGKRNSGCDASFIPMMGGWGSFGTLGWFSMLLVWVLLILGVITLVRYLTKTSGGRKEFKEKKKDLT